MPSLKQHCKISKERTGKTFEDLHKWMDESYNILNEHHRHERHSTLYLKFVKEKWGNEGIKEFLNHIIEDYKHTLSKFEGKCIECGKPTYRGMARCKVCYKKFKEMEK